MLISASTTLNTLRCNNLGVKVCLWYVGKLTRLVACDRTPLPFGGMTMFEYIGSKCRARRAKVAGTIALGLCVAACSGGERSKTVDVVTADSAGVRIRNPRTPRWTDRTRWRIDTAPLFRVTTEGSDSAPPFRRFVSPVLLADGGTAFVTELPELRWYDARGQLRGRRRIRGAGPGEFSSPPVIIKLGGDTLELSDLVGRREATFDRNGRLVGTTAVEPAKLYALGKWAECTVRRWPRGYRTICAEDASIPKTGTNKPRRFIGDGLTSPGNGHYRPLRRTWLLTPALDSAMPLGIEGGTEQYGTKEGAFVIHPFYSRSLVAAGGTPFRVYTMRNPEYDIAVWDSVGRLIERLQLSNTRYVATDDDNEAARALMIEREASGPGRQQFLQSLSQLEAPDTLPASDGMFVAETGELLVHRMVPSSASDSSRTDVFNHQGDWLGTIVLPPRTYIGAVTRDRVLLIRRDDDDVMTLEVRRLYRPNTP